MITTEQRKGSYVNKLKYIGVRVISINWK